MWLIMYPPLCVQVDLATTTTEVTSLFGLPDTVLSEISSWCSSARTAAAFHKTSRILRRLRHSPAAAALLLLRCPCRNYASALSTYGTSPASSTALTQQLLQLLHAGPDGGGPHTAPASLVRALLTSACATGDMAAVHSLMALPQPPNVHAGGGAALMAALVHGPHLDIMQVLLSSGADPSSPDLYCMAGRLPQRLPALQLLLQHCPAAVHATVKTMALGEAVHSDNATCVAFLLPAPYVPEPVYLNFARVAAMTGKVSILCLLLEHAPPPKQQMLDLVLLVACRSTQRACVELLLNSGADASANGSQTLLQALKGSSVSVEGTLEVVRLLLQRGALVTVVVRQAAFEMAPPLGDPTLWG